MAKFTCNFISYSLKRAAEITVIIPSPTYVDTIGKGSFADGEVTHRPKEKYPVLYLLHGIGNDHAAWTTYTNVALYAEEQNIAVVMMSAENKHYVNQPGKEPFYDFLEKELPDFVCSMFPVSERKEDTFIAGLSMGGYGALIHGFSSAGRYAAVGAFSPALHIDPTISEEAPETEGRHVRPPQYDPFVLAKQWKEKEEDLPLYLSCGEEDFLFDLNVQFKEHLEHLGLPFTWIQQAGYGHEWRFWDKQVEMFLEWLPRRDYYAGKKRCC